MAKTWTDAVQHAKSAADAVQRAAAARGISIASDYAAQEIANAACAFYDDVLFVRQFADRSQWEMDDGFRSYLRQHMRHELLDTVTRQGFVPVMLPLETVRYVTGGFLDPGNSHEVPESGNWQAVVVTLEVPVRRPSVDRVAAVKAGILAGGEPQ